MGLDQYAYAVMPHRDNTDFNYVWGDKNHPEYVNHIHQWRKHPNLHGWMEDLYYEKLDKSDQTPKNSDDWNHFNCQPVRLTSEDIDRLDNDVNEENLPSTQGFFFGESNPEHKKHDNDFIEKARDAMKNGMEVYYDSWW